MLRFSLKVLNLLTHLKYEISRNEIFPSRIPPPPPVCLTPPLQLQLGLFVHLLEFPILLSLMAYGKRVFCPHFCTFKIPRIEWRRNKFIPLPPLEPPAHDAGVAPSPTSCLSPRPSNLSCLSAAILSTQVGGSAAVSMVLGGQSSQGSQDLLVVQVDEGLF